MDAYLEEDEDSRYDSGVVAEEEASDGGEEGEGEREAGDLGLVQRPSRLAILRRTVIRRDWCVYHVRSFYL